MSDPVRLQLSRRKGFNLQALGHATNGRDVVNVARPSRWGNHVRVEQLTAAIAGTFDWSGVGGAFGDARWAAYFRDRDETTRAGYRAMAQAAAVEAYALEMRQFMRADPEGFAHFIAPLRGRNLACWCKSGEPCHADVLLEMANGDAADA